MAGVVVGVHRITTAQAPVHWAAEQARRRHLPLTLLHAWHEPVSITVPLDAHDLPDLDQPASTHAEPGRAAKVLLAQPAQLLVIGGHAGTPHLRRATRTCVERADCPVAVVPDDAPAQPERVVVGIDHTAASAAALVWAGETANLLGCPLVAIHAWQWHPRSPAGLLHHRQSFARQQVEEQQRLAAQIDAARIATDDVQVVAVHGAPLDTFLDVLQQSDVLVVGRREHNRVGGLTHGAVGEDLSALLPCAVVVVPPTG